LGFWGDSARAYQKAVDAGMGGNRAIFQYADALSKSENEKDRELGILKMKELAKSEKNDFWKKMAIQKIANEKWK
jgi:hypothetical protein